LLDESASAWLPPKWPAPIRLAPTPEDYAEEEAEEEEERKRRDEDGDDDDETRMVAARMTKTGLTSRGNKRNTNIRAKT